MEDQIKENTLLESQFGYSHFYDSTPRRGWLLNYNVVRNEYTEMFVDLFFVDEHAQNFKARLPHYPSFLVECTEDHTGIEEYFARKYPGRFQAVELVHRIDVSEHNHLNRPPKSFLKFSVRTEADFAQITKEAMVREQREDSIYQDFCAEAESTAYKIFEHDIPVDVQAGNTHGIRCGTWYDVSYDGSAYKIVRDERITHPDLRVLAFDIETTKPPLKFPDAENDQIMMISILTESFGELIVNRQVISEDIQEFEYEAKEEMRSIFRISNEATEEGLLIRFIEIVQRHMPHIITTYNGGFFDWPFVETRAAKYALSLATSISFRATHEYYESPFIMHLDCYKWVKRDSYLPMNNQGLKDAARIKLGYFPDEIDPEDMVRFAREDPQKLASYSVSDAVATYYLYTKFVHPHIFSISSIIPLPTVQILCKGAGTLCEALLFSESISYRLLIPPRARIGGLKFRDGRIVENLTYIGGHVESLHAGIFRADFEHDFAVDDEAIDLTLANLDDMLAGYQADPGYAESRRAIAAQLEAARGRSRQRGCIYHLDVGAMYPNIILTNRMQPIAVVNEDVCIHCDFNSKESTCKRKMAWVARADYLPPSKNEVNMIRNQLENETFYMWETARKEEARAIEEDAAGDVFGLHKKYDAISDEYASISDAGKINFKHNNDGINFKHNNNRMNNGWNYKSNINYGKYKSEENGFRKGNAFANDKRSPGSFDSSKDAASLPKKVPYASLPLARQEDLLKERVIEYSKKIYKKAKKVETRVEELTICQREVPFYVETVRKFRDQRNAIKALYKAAVREYEADPTLENKKKTIVYNSLQIAYKCVLNSFYGYVMRTGSRWFSLEMAAAVCHVGGEIIRLAREFVEKIGIPLELDTDGIWCLLPAGFPSTVRIGEKKVSLISILLNYFVCKKFTNDQYQIRTDDGGYETVSQNSIAFEVDGPYKAMVIPSSTEENRLLKKRYVVFDSDDKVAELKGFELKRRGELSIIKKFQEDVFEHFTDGSTLQECYDALAAVCNYWLDIIYTEGAALDDESIFELFSESRNMSRSADCYGGQKSNILGTARRLAEFLGENILQDKLKCEFIISRYPENAPTAERAIPVLAFRHQDKELLLRRWLKNSCTELRKILDWTYYKRRFEDILQRLIVIPAYFQNIKNPIERIEVPRWIKNARRGKLGFQQIGDIEDVGLKRSLSEIFYSEANKRCEVDVLKYSGSAVAECANGSEEVNNGAVHPSKIAEIIKNGEEQAACLSSAKIEGHAEDRNAVDTKGQPFEKPGIGTRELMGIISLSKKDWLNFYNKKGILTKIEYNGDGTYSLKYIDGSVERKPFIREILLEVNDSAYFEEHERVARYLPGSTVPSEFMLMRIPETEFRPQRYRKFFGHFAIKSVYGHNDNPLHQLVSQHEAGPIAVEYAIISSFVWKAKPVFCITAAETCFISEMKQDKAAKSGDEAKIQSISLHGFRARSLDTYRIVVFNKNDPSAKEIGRVFGDTCAVGLDLTVSAFLESLGSLMRIQYDLHLRMRVQYQQLLDISELFKIPLLNVDENVLELIYYKELYRAGVLCAPAEGFIPSILKDETYKPGYYPTHAVELECTGSQLLAVIEHAMLVGDGSSFDGLCRQDFFVLRELLKRLLVASLHHNSGAAALLKGATRWLRKDSALIPGDVREILNVLQQKYLIGLAAKIKELQCRIISMSRELMIIDTGKKDAEGCELYIAYIRAKVSAMPGYELLKLRLVRRFERLALVDPANYFYVENGALACFSPISIPKLFLDIYFSDADITNEQVYGIVSRIELASAKMLLRLLSYKRDTHGLASNCYKLLRVSEFDDEKEHQLNLTVFCRHCGLENLIRKKCLKCYAEIDKASLEAECTAYLRHLWALQIGGDRYCSVCRACEEKKLKEYCRCGGKFEMRDYREEIAGLKAFVNTRKFDDAVEEVYEYFKNTEKEALPSIINN